jgi:hypothetical protein
MCTEDNGPFESHGRLQSAHSQNHCSQASVLGSQDQLCATGARRRRSGGGPVEGCARRPVGTYLYLHAVGVGDPIAVLGLAR